MTASKSVQEALLRQLKDPFDPRFVKWRVGATNEKRDNGRVVQKATKGIALAYIDSREVKKRLDEVMGIAGWKDELIEVKDGFVDILYLKIDDEWIPRSGAGEHTKMSPVKGGASDAFKRAAAKWGIGHYLYYLPNTWVAVDEYKHLKAIPELPNWAKPSTGVENWEDVAELEADLNSGEDFGQIDGIVLEEDEINELVSKASNRSEFTTLLRSLTPDQKRRATPIITQRIKELKDAKTDKS